MGRLIAPELSERDIHTWQSNLDLPILEIEELDQTLSDDERVKARRFHFEEDRKRFIARHGILRMILGWYLGVGANELRFSYGRNGKPRLVDEFGRADIHFSMSSSEGLALYGFTCNREIGVDVECVRDIPEMDHIVSKFFSVRENEVLELVDESSKKKTFFNWWTRKEALVKARGDGLSQALDKVDVSPMGAGAPGVVKMEEDSRTTGRWFIQDLEPASGFAAAFAVEGCWRPPWWRRSE